MNLTAVLLILTGVFGVDRRGKEESFRMRIVQTIAGCSGIGDLVQHIAWAFRREPLIEGWT